MHILKFNFYSQMYVYMHTYFSHLEYQILQYLTNFSSDSTNESELVGTWFSRDS